MPFTSAFGSSVRECSLSVHEYHWSIVGRTGRHTSFGTRGRRFKSCHSDQHLAPSETSIPTASPTDTRRFMRSPMAGADVSRRRLDKQRANHLFLLTDSPPIGYPPCSQ